MHWSKLLKLLAVLIEKPAQKLGVYSKTETDSKYNSYRDAFHSFRVIQEKTK